MHVFIRACDSSFIASLFQVCRTIACDCLDVCRCSRAWENTGQSEWKMIYQYIYILIYLGHGSKELFLKKYNRSKGWLYSSGVTAEQAVAAISARLDTIDQFVHFNTPLDPRPWAGVRTIAKTLLDTEIYVTCWVACPPVQQSTAAALLEF